MSNSTRTIGADLESPFLDEEIVGTAPGAGAADTLEFAEDEVIVTEEEQLRDADAAESEDQEPEVTEECELESGDEGPVAEWDLELAAEEGEGAEAAARVVFPSGESLTVLTGLPVAKAEEYWDPTGSNNPLLDTGPAYKDKKLSTSFTVRELTTSGGVSADVARIDPKLVAALQRLRDHVGKAVTITSGFRSWKRNKQVYERRKAKATLSQHCGGRAADIRIEGMNGLEIARAAIDACGPDIGVGLGKTFAHIDVRGVATVWDYGSAPDPWIADVKRYQKSKGGRSTLTPPIPERRGPPLAEPSAEIVRFTQRVLNATEGERLIDDGDLGPLTRSALERFRKRYGLGTTNVIDAKTEIALAQRALEEIAQQSMFPQAGVLDAKTRDALTAFKASRGLAVGPALDAATRQALTEALAKRASLSVPRPSGSSAAARPSTTKEASERVVHVSPTGKIQGLEKGVKVSTTMSFRPDVSDRRDLVIAATGAAEGGFDTVNMYDRGILSWGMMQWTLHAGGLQKALSFIKERLTAQGNSSLWSRLFGGLDLRDNDIVYQGELVTTKNNSRLREIFRGAAKPNEYDRTTAEHWARIFARAGRDPVIQALQTAYARKEVDALLEVRLGAVLAALRRRCSKRPEGGTWKYVCPKLTEGPEVYVKRYPRLGDYVGTVLKTLALVFGMKINNPAGAYAHLMVAVDALAAKYSTHDIEVWPAGWQVALGDELERILRASGFAMWGDAKAKRAGRLSRTTKILHALKKLTLTV